MNVSRSGYYKWLKNKDVLNKYELDRLELSKLIEEIHKRKPSYGYRRINARILVETGWIVTDNLVHKVCKALKIKSKAKHYKYKKPGEESLKYENLVKGNWKTTRPFEIIVSDTTTFWFKRKPYDWTYYLDVFNNEIVGSDVRESKHGSNVLNHREALKNIDGIRTMSEKEGVKYNYSYFPIFVDAEKYGITRDELYEQMKMKGVYGRRYFYPLITQFEPYCHLSSATSQNLPIATKVANQVICLPMHHALTNEDIERVINCIKR